MFTGKNLKSSFGKHYIFFQPFTFIIFKPFGVKIKLKFEVLNIQ